jgi:integrase
LLRRRINLVDNAVTVGNRVVVGTLKGHHNRVVSMPRFVAEALAKVCAGRGRDELLWTDANGLPMKPPASKDSWLSGAVERCMKVDETFPRITAHSLRHTYASLAVSSGANVKVIQRQLGHKSASVTLDVYSDLFDTDMDAVAQAFDLECAHKCAQSGPTAGQVGG